MEVTRAEQSPRTKWIIFGSPLAILGILVGVEVVAISQEGFKSVDPLLWVLYSSCMAFFCLLILTIPRSVVVNDEGIHFARFVGRPRVIQWGDVQEIDVKGQAGNKGLNVKTSRGRAVTIPGIMVNYEKVATAITARME
jgi:hypothetical protein